MRRSATTVAAMVLLGGLGAPVAWAAGSVDVACDTAALVNAFSATQADGGPSVINLAKDCEYRLTTPVQDSRLGDPSGLPALRGPVTVNGNNATLRRPADAPRFRILHVWESRGNTVTVNDLTITGGHTRDGAVQGNQDLPAGSGAGIFVQGDLVLNNTKVIGNRTGNGHNLGGSSGGTGGGIVAMAGVKLTLAKGSAVRGNRTGDGGSAGVVSTIPGSGGTAGGIYGHNITVLDSEVSDNHTGNGGAGEFGGFGGAGGGIFQTWTNWLTLRNATISGNSTGDGGPTTHASSGGRQGGGGEGGGIRTGDGPDTVSVVDSRITNNTSGTGDGLQPADGAGALFHGADNFLMTGTLVEGNRARSPKAEGAGLSLSGEDGRPLVIRDSIIRGNRNEGVDSVGGGISIWLGTLDLERVTVTGNSSAGAGSGGGVHVVTRSDRATVNLRTGTVVRDNTPRNCNAGLVRGCAN